MALLRENPREEPVMGGVGQGGWAELRQEES